jgi:hypothetical protein
MVFFAIYFSPQLGLLLKRLIEIRKQAARFKSERKMVFRSTGERALQHAGYLFSGFVIRLFSSGSHSFSVEQRSEPRIPYKQRITDDEDGCNRGADQGEFEPDGYIQGLCQGLSGYDQW